MPRLTTKHYLEIHQMLNYHWFHDPALYCQLSANEQWDLHTFFWGYKELSDVALGEHRRTISKQDPSLPQRAGRALSRFKRVVELRTQIEPGQLSFKRAPKGSCKVVTYPLVQPELDLAQLARVIIAIERLNRKAAEQKPKL
jgi:hypothetical protein